MPLDVFQLKDAVVSEYKDYLESFVQVLDPRIDQYVGQELSSGALWPDAVLQLNPAFEADLTLGELADQGILTDETARFFGPDVCLYQHQREALDIGLTGASYVVTTGTGSGKSLTYLLPIYDAIIRNNPQERSVRALLIYPMNALINSQLEALERFQERNWPESPVSFARYTGQTSEEDRNRLQQDPPHILLTNYVMAEYLLLRPSERTMLQTATSNLQTLVMDELHFYRGRQGADVAMLTRRLQEAAGRDLQAVATSATIVAGEQQANSGAGRKETVAKLASSFFGQEMPPTCVVDETLRRVAEAPVPQGEAELRAAVEAPLPQPSVAEVKTHPLTAWIEEAFGVAYQAGSLVRRQPETFANAAQTLSAETGLPLDTCVDRLRSVLEIGSQAQSDGGEPILAFRLHQWLSSGGSVSATLESADRRQFTIDGQYRLDDERLLFPLSFCRECGQEYYQALRIDETGQQWLNPRSPVTGASDESIEGQGGFFALEVDGLWAGDTDELPEEWFNENRSGRRVKPNYAAFIPAKYRAFPDGRLAPVSAAAVSSEPTDGEIADDSVVGWYQPQPFLICLRCRAVYDRRQGEYRKLSSLSQTGRSTATTIAVNAAVSEMTDQGLPTGEAKALSFTDNRQDASLQAGHLNDFVQVALLRAGIVEALERNDQVTFDRLGNQVFDALALDPDDFLREPVDSGPGYDDGKRAMVSLLEYLALEDLGRGWRITQPNLEQAGLMRIEYPDLHILASEEDRWQNLPAIAEATPEKRTEALKVFLDHLRMNLVIDAGPLTQEEQRSLTRRAEQWLKDPWRLEETDILARQGLALLPGKRRGARESNGRATMSLGARSAILRYMRSQHTWNANANLSVEAGEALVNGIISQLRGHFLSVVQDSRGEDRGVRLLAASMRWTSGDGRPLPPDPVRSRSLHLRKEVTEVLQANTYFAALYRQGAKRLRGMLAAPHSGQVSAADREIRERQFREGTLSTLFCSPTMELGVDINDLDAVHLRNIPPTPANYAQRSGRAGRGGRPALIVAFAAHGNAHDQYYFSRRNEMIAGAVTPARMDLRNQDMVKAHLYSAWLATTGIFLGSGMQEILDLSDPNFPIKPDLAPDLTGQNRDRHFRTAVVRAQNIIARTPETQDAPWYSDHWLEETIRSAPDEFNQSFDRWRDLYRAASRERDTAREKMDDHNANRRDRQAAEQQEWGARREIDLLLNRTNRPEDSDFYPYRYLAGEGFLPGYNFPRLPVRVSVPVRDNHQMIDRPRFLGLSEFGPGNQVYHEGRKYQVNAAVIPPSGIDAAFTKARLCRTCGRAHDGAEADLELCRHCGTILDGSSDFPQRLLEQPTMRARKRERISSEEEERIRTGYRITTHFDFDPSRLQRAESLTEHEDTVLNAEFAPGARLWRINHGWRQSEDNGSGFSIDPQTGRWETRRNDAEPNDDPAVSGPITGVRTYVHDYRNVLFLRPKHEDSSLKFQSSLLHALKRAIQFMYQVEEQEIGAELIGEGEHRRMILWEAAEGGIGVWEQLVNEPKAFANVARMALRICHDDASKGDDAKATNVCVSACYQCLLTYSNQLEHRLIDRRAIMDYLRDLASSTTIPEKHPDQSEHYERLLRRVDPNSSLEKEFLLALRDNRLKLPDDAQNRPTSKVPAQPDFYYERENRPGVCVFIDGPHHDSPDQQHTDAQVRSELQDYGFRVITIRYDRPIIDQIKEHPNVFVATGQFDGPTTDLQETFDELAAEWRAETAGLSSPRAITGHAAYQQIIEMGEPAIRLILQDMETNGGWWYPALRELTGTNPVPETAKGSLPLNDEAWLQWGRQNGYA